MIQPRQQGRGVAFMQGHTSSALRSHSFGRSPRKASSPRSLSSPRVCTFCQYSSPMFCKFHTKCCEKRAVELQNLRLLCFNKRARDQHVRLSMPRESSVMLKLHRTQILTRGAHAKSRAATPPSHKQIHQSPKIVRASAPRTQQKKWTSSKDGLTMT